MQSVANKKLLGLKDCEGQGQAVNRVYVRWALRPLPDREIGAFEFTASGEIWERGMRDCISCGQNCETIRTLYPDDKWVQRFCDVWDKWHLNAMRPGCAHQMADGWDKRPIDPQRPLRDYGKFHPKQKSPTWNMLAWVYKAEVPGGLLTEPCPICGERYGAKWYYEPLPQDILEEIKSWK